MKIDWSKLGLWIAAVGVLAGLVGMRDMRPSHHVTAPVTPPVVAPVVPPAPPVTPLIGPAKAAPVVVVKPVVKPAVKHRPRPKAKPAPVAPPPVVRHVHKVRPCAAIPKQAYEHDENTVVSFARGRGVSEADIEKLRRCIARHTGHVNEP